MNKVILIGNLGKDVETLDVGGTALGKTSLATTKRFTKDGHQESKTTWHNLVMWGKVAELAGNYLAKGSKVCVVGEIETNEHEGKYYTNIVVREIEFLDSKKDSPVREEPKMEPMPKNDVTF